VLETFGERSVVIRLIDLGGDKQLPYLPLPAEDNPFLGIRGFRLVEHHEDLLLTQLRAVLAAAERTATQPWIMAPMIADLDDVHRLHALVADAAVGRSLPRAPRVGVMVELPAAMTLADKIAAEVAFMSIGTNDLTQYLFAADRTNPALAGRQDPLHPAVLRSIAATVAAGHLAGIPVAVCGEMAGDPVGALALAGLGIDELSMDAGAFAAVKRAPAAVRQQEAAAAVREAMDADRASEARSILERLIAQ
jgi:multiphosphoryl transfer protein